ncbi:aldo/keto reductase [Patulibacter americanus]|uniref:aldo/keto reductase n=1 Tax=Patulibacter americanus TaxID=588672 RepID=UPI0003B5D837|nr:aldo/keto reductase [Patulibacter americanus]
MQYAQLGRTGLYVSRLTLGAMTFGGGDVAPWNAVGNLSAAESAALVHQALDAGINVVDTANVYGGGESEELVGRALASRRDEVVLATKLHPRVGPGPNDVGQSRRHVTRAIEDSLRRLGTDHVDLLQLHNFDALTPMEETLRALDDAVRAGKVLYIGVSNWAAWQLQKGLGLSTLHGLERFATLQAYYSLAGRDLEREILPLVRDAGVGLLTWSPLAGGFLSGKFGREGTTDTGSRRTTTDFPPVDREAAYDIIDVLRVVAEQQERSVAQVALAWVLAQRGVTSVITGVRRPDQLTDNLGALDVVLTPDQLRALDQISAPPPAYPGWIQSTEGRRPAGAID